jgi:hypothetical protein
VYWDGKLREIEKEPNFYSTLPIKNKLFFPKAVKVGKSILLESPLQKLPILGGDFNEKAGNVGEMAPFLKNFRGAVENSEVFSPLLKVNYKNFYTTNLTTSSLEATLTNYRFTKNFYTKNSKNIVESLEGLTSLDNLWALNKNNSAARVYPNLVKSLLSGNLLIGVKESEGGFNTNLISVRDPIWSAVDRYFLNFSKKNTQDLVRLNLELEQSYCSEQIKNSRGITTLFKNSDHSDMNRWLKRGWGLSDPLRLIKLASSDLEESGVLLRFRFNNKNSTVLNKSTNNIYLALKQKRYVIRKKFPIKKKFKKLINNESSTESVDASKLRLRTLVKNNYFKAIDEKSALLSYKFLKKSKKHSEVIPVPLARRILRTKRTLVLPAHINLTVITNSYDVVHSWFIPSLGVKMDCVPGRSTHHVLFIDSVGFYYGQCAEICGRYHHHMPIRLCALPFEHFLLW